ncbi:MAG: porin family protein [Pricia sp.]
MKSSFPVFFLICCLGMTGSNAQVFQGNGPSGGSAEINFGAKAGLNISTFVGDEVNDISSNLGAYVGGMAEIPMFFDDFYLQPELLLSFQGPDIGPEDLNLTYIHLPIMAKYHIIDKIAVELGPQIGYKIADNTDDIPGLETNSFQFALNAGGGYRLNDNFYFQLRYGLGFSNVLESPDLRNAVFSVGACYFF